MERPIINSYGEPSEFIRDMLLYRKTTERQFSVRLATRRLRRISPALVSLVLQKKRKLTLDRVEEFGRLLNLNSAERIFFQKWVLRLEEKNQNDGSTWLPEKPKQSSKNVGVGILSDWINLYVKDLFLIPAIRKNPSLLESQLGSVATSSRVKKALQFLLREGHLRKSIDGSIVIDTNLSVTDPGVPSRKIRQFHKNALSLARQALDLYPQEERRANTLLIALNEDRHKELLEMCNEFSEKLLEFASHETPSAERLYQVVLNLSPVGGKLA